MKQLFVLCLLIVSLVISCKKDLEGDVAESGLPETYMVVDSVKRDNNNYLITTVTAFWWGNSAKGFIKGYEVSTDGMQTWKFTTEQKGTFLLNLPVGVKKGEIPVYVRAIDNYGRKDPSPAQMIFPVQNSAPRIALDAENITPDKSFPVIKFNWRSSDIDGFVDIDHYDLFLNDSSFGLFSVPGTIRDLAVNDTTVSASVRIEGRVVSGTFVNVCDVYASGRTTALAGTLNGIQYDSLNYIYIRAVDRTGNQSAWIKDSLMVVKPKSDVLLVNCLLSNSVSVQNFYLTNLANPYVGVSTVETVRGVNSLNGASELYVDALTQQRTFNLFKKIIWLTDDPYNLATAQLTTTEFFNNNGRMFIYAQFNDDFPVNASVLSFTPIQSLVNPSSDPAIVNGRFRMDNTCYTIPVLSSLPMLKFSGAISVVRPFITNTTSSGIFTYDSLMNGVVRIQSSSGSPYWTGSSTMMSRRIKFATGKSDMIITSLPLQALNGNNNMDTLFRKVFIDELAF